MKSQETCLNHLPLMAGVETYPQGRSTLLLVSVIDSPAFISKETDDAITREKRQRNY